VLTALVCHPFADARLLLPEFVSGPHQPLLPATSFAPVGYCILPGRPGTVTLPVAYSRGWTLNGRPAGRLADGQTGVRAPAEGGIAHYDPFAGVAASEIGSLAHSLRSRALHSLRGESGHPAVPPAAQTAGGPLAPLISCRAEMKLRRNSPFLTISQDPSSRKTP
jgi:hypothetical protein